MQTHMRRRLYPCGLDICNGSPETDVSELQCLRGSHAPALPFAQRTATYSRSAANGQATVYIERMRRSCERFAL